MARKDALIKLYRRLDSRKRELLSSISDDLLDLSRGQGERGGFDDADAAAEAINESVISQLAQIESKELAQIMRAMQRIREGNYGTCEMCQKKIALARLNALPFSTFCIDCQREIEADPQLADSQDAGWGKLYDHENANREVNNISVKLG